MKDYKKIAENMDVGDVYYSTNRQETLGIQNAIRAIGYRSSCKPWLGRMKITKREKDVNYHNADLDDKGRFSIYSG